jgi:hypothetical protein
VEALIFMTGTSGGDTVIIELLVTVHVSPLGRCAFIVIEYLPAVENKPVIVSALPVKNPLPKFQSKEVPEGVPFAVNITGSKAHPCVLSELKPIPVHWANDLGNPHKKKMSKSKIRLFM